MSPLSNTVLFKESLSSRQYCPKKSDLSIGLCPHLLLVLNVYSDFEVPDWYLDRFRGFELLVSTAKSGVESKKVQPDSPVFILDRNSIPETADPVPLVSFHTVQETLTAESETALPSTPKAHQSLNTPKSRRKLFSKQISLETSSPCESPRASTRTTALKSTLFYSPAQQRKRKMMRLDNEGQSLDTDDVTALKIKIHDLVDSTDSVKKLQAVISVLDK